MPPHLRYPLLAVAAFWATAATAQPLEAQYRRGVLVYTGSCRTHSAQLVRSVEGGWEVRLNGVEAGVRSLNADAPVRVVSSAAGSRDLVVSTSQSEQSMLHEIFTDAGRCRVSMERRNTADLVTNFRTAAEDADREFRSWKRFRNALYIGGLGILGATGYYVATSDPIELLPLGLGLGLGAWVASLGGTEAQPEVDRYRQLRDYNRSMERLIIEQAR